MIPIRTRRSRILCNASRLPLDWADRQQRFKAQQAMDKLREEAMRLQAGDPVIPKDAKRRIKL